MRKSKLSWYKQSRLIELFVAGSTARTAASLVGVNKTTASYYFHRLRLLIYENSQEPGLLEGEIEVDTSIDATIALKQSKNRHFITSTATTFAFASAAKVALINFYFAF